MRKCQGKNKKSEKIKLKQASEGLIKIGYNRISGKVKNIRQTFCNALVNGTRSGRGRIVLEHFDLLKMIYGGARATNLLTFSFVIIKSFFFHL